MVVLAVALACFAFWRVAKQLDYKPEHHLTASDVVARNDAATLLDAFITDPG